MLRSHSPWRFLFSYLESRQKFFPAWVVKILQLSLYLQTYSATSWTKQQKHRLIILIRKLWPQLNRIYNFSYENQTVKFSLATAAYKDPLLRSPRTTAVNTKTLNRKNKPQIGFIPRQIQEAFSLRKYKFIHLFSNYMSFIYAQCSCEASRGQGHL